MTDISRLESEKNIWLATVRPDGRPHLVPIWFVWHNQEIFILTMLSSVKARNLLHTPRASLSLEDGNRPIIVECSARLVRAPHPAGLSEAFMVKYEWDISKDGAYNGMFALKPQKWLTWTA